MSDLSNSQVNNTNEKPDVNAGFNYNLKVYMSLKGRDISQQIRPLIQSFFGNVKYELVTLNDQSYNAKLDQASDGEITFENADYAFVMDFGEEEMTIDLYKEGEKIDSFKSATDPDVKEYRYIAGRGIYDMLVKLTGRKLPWGILVGIRPTKHVYELMTEGVGEDVIRDHYIKDFYASEEKTDLAIDIAGREKRILSSFDYVNGYSIYIGIPFCPTTCLYCSFTSYPLAKFGSYMDDYIDALIKEIEYSRDALPGKKLNTIYIGGGTPTALDDYNLERLLEAVHKYLPVKDTLEFCLEAGRPDTITKEKLAILKKYGVNRISINPQSLNQKTLDIIGRKHTVEDIYRSFDMARELGHDNINMDLIVGLTGEGLEEVKNTLEGVKILRPESLTVHTLALKRAARLRIENEKYHGMEGTETAACLDMCQKYAKSQGLNPYYLYRQKNMSESLENVGYAIEGKECLYNILIMEEKQTILALGAGATSKYIFRNDDRLERTENVKSLTDYIDRVDEMIDRKRNFIAQYGDEL